MNPTVILCFQNIYPATDGGKKSALGRVLDLKRRDPNCTVHVICFDLIPFSSVDTMSAKSFFEAQGVSHTFISGKRSLRPNRFGLKILSLFSKSTFYTLYSSTPEIRNQVEKILAQQPSFDIVCEGLYSFFALPLKYREHATLIAHNLEHTYLKSLSRTSSSVFKKIFHRLNSHKTVQEEKIAFTESKEIHFLNPIELNEAKVIFNLQSSKLQVANNSLPPIQSLDRSPDLSTPFLLFPGSLTFSPNYEGIRWFADFVYPQIRRDYPQIRLVITGNYTQSIYEEFNLSQGFELTGLISEKELANLYTRCLVVISPILTGAGVKIKNLEAIQRNAPLVMSKTSSSGIATQTAQQIACESDSPQEFYKYLVKLISIELGKN